ncbi:MAG: hypothetical protein IJL02_10080 [Methanobrevibacter sp.]|uniref:hypothetical protein n=1 Tax=Methanobrevibacter sp. TaxID=66852 RepID=UPI0025EA005D|nr:hypothetical protein [Methanobrevibacter sp.]MBQ6100190.1 hypothetical protein [Methanobrevibacter sp.]
MIIFIISNVYLLIRLVSLYDFSDVLSMRLNGGGKSGVGHLPHRIILSKYHDTTDSNKR